ncbi:unnamed protein product [Zymoseptoria tritici ST99CH_1E4]|uniref:Uncharacterized protein n=1 Tax=Zymoseptoria tritici ST99CH_1E4 TaxID=1276532 RepID=A0A2H1GPU6_ZYMTR|nr:unnamed protein product [Zymoseptoria tritici ST99CH_1E4]
MNPWYRQRKPFRRQMLDHIIAKFVGKVEEETGSGSVIIPSPPLLLRGNDERADFIRFLRLLHGLVQADPKARDLAMRSVYFLEVHPKREKTLFTVSHTAATMPTIEQNSSNAKGPLESRTAEGHAEDGSATVFVSELSSDWTVVDIEDTQSTVC